MDLWALRSHRADANGHFLKRDRFTADDVQKLVLRIGHLLQPRQQSATSRHDILAWNICLAVMASTNITFHRPLQSAYEGPRCSPGRAKIEVVADPRIDASPPQRDAIVELTLKDGTQLSEWFAMFAALRIIP